MNLDQSELNTLIYALEVAVKYQKELATKHNNDVFVREDFIDLLNKAKKEQRRSTKKS